MPKIINAYATDANESVANSLKSLGESMFGNQAQQQVYRETAKEKGRHNTNAEPYARALRDGDSAAALYYGSQAGHNGADLGSGNLAAAASRAGSNYAAPELATAALGAGHSFSGTVPGERENIAQRAHAADQATARAAATQLSIDARTLTPMRDANGTIQMVPKSEVPNFRGQGWNAAETPDTSANNRTSIATNAATNTQSGANTAATVAGANYRHDTTPHTVLDNGVPTVATNATAPGRGALPLSTDQVTAGLIQRETQPPQASADVPVGQSESAAPTTPTGYIHPLVQKALGYGQGAVPYQHLQSGAVGQSYDGGKTVDGHPAGPGWVPVTSQDAVGQTRTNEQIQNASVPLPAPPAAYPQAAQDAAATSGAKSLVQSEANKTLGFFGGPEIGANTNRARENLTNLANEARSVVLSAPGRAAVQAQRWANASIPQPGALGMTGANADQQRNAVITFTQHLRSIYQTEAQEAQDRATPPAERAKIIQHMAQLKRIIGAYEAPAGGPQPASAVPGQGAPPQQAPQAGAQPSAPQSVQTPHGTVTFQRID